MAYKLSEFPNVKGQVAGVLKSLGIADTDQLLMLVTDPAQRADLLQKLGVDERMLNDLIEQTDLTRVKGIGPSFAVLTDPSGHPLRAATGAGQPCRASRQTDQDGSYNGRAENPARG